MCYENADDIDDRITLSFQGSKGRRLKMQLVDKIYQKIRDDVTHGKLSPGERLLESKLVGEFKCSRSPVREALRRLQSEGLLIFEPNKGSTICKLSSQDIGEIYSIISYLEGYAARLSVERFDRNNLRNNLSYLRELQKKLKKAAEADDPVQWLENNTLFHNFFSQHAGNAILCQMLENLRRRVYQYRYITIRIRNHFEKYLNHHQRILEAYEAFDGKMIEKVMRLHTETVRDVLIDYLNKFPSFR